jgi:DNA-binding response OmpR family regulator
MMARVLVADDSETILLLMRTRLEMEGHEVETAADGQQVMDALRREGGPKPDLLLLDAMMPKVSGIDALRELRAAGIDTPALIVSAHREPNGEGDEDLGIDGYVGKPIDFEALFERIGELTRPGPAGGGPGRKQPAY